MSDIKTCSKNHGYDSAWDQCPYCDESLSELPDAADVAITLIGWIVVLSGQDAGSDFRLEAGSNLIGIDDDCNIILEDEYVSGQHAKIEGVHQDEALSYTLTDLGSTNGTLLNDSDSPIEQVDLQDGDIVTFGSTRVKFKSFQPG
jgi:pSer/pThr/pTyr-binding forkhead associated (FHA) protein